VTSDSAKYVAKIEPYSNGPLFVEIHCLLKAGKQTDEEPLPPGMPRYVASGSHYFHNSRYRFLILPRFKTDLHSIIKNRRVKPKNVLTIATQILDVLEHLHDKGYAHSDIKAENLMIGDSLYYGERPLIPDHQPERERKSARLERDASPSRQVGGRAKKLASVQYSGSNPMRSCRRKIINTTTESTAACASNHPVSSITNVDGNEIYDEMLQTHYLRPSKSINYSYNEYDDDDVKSEYSDKNDRDFDMHEGSPLKRLPLSSAKKTLPPSVRHAQTIIKIHNQVNGSPSKKVHREERIFLIDFGLASKFIDSAGAHRPFCMDQRRAHDGTLEFTSRDAHMGAHSRRSDLECLGE
jgi:serine/threonine protein kinase